MEEKEAAAALAKSTAAAAERQAQKVAAASLAAATAAAEAAVAAAPAPTGQGRPGSNVAVRALRFGLTSNPPKVILEYVNPNTNQTRIRSLRLDDLHAAQEPSAVAPIIIAALPTLR